MLDLGAIEGVIEDIGKVSGVENVVVISKSGMHLAGKVPKSAHLETYSAMLAILLGAAETVSSEIGTELGHVVIKFSGSRMMVMDNGPKAVLALTLSKTADEAGVASEVRSASKKLEELI